MNPIELDGLVQPSIGDLPHRGCHVACSSLFGAFFPAFGHALTHFCPPFFGPILGRTLQSTRACAIVISEPTAMAPRDLPRRLSGHQACQRHGRVLFRAVHAHDVQDLAPYMDHLVDRADAY